MAAFFACQCPSWNCWTSWPVFTG